MLAAGEEVDRAVEVEGVAGEEVRGDEVVDALLVDRVQVLELVRGREPLDVQPVGQDEIGRASCRERV